MERKEFRPTLSLFAEAEKMERKVFRPTLRIVPGAPAAEPKKFLQDIDIAGSLEYNTQAALNSASAMAA